jgi:hypothetical protein
VKVPFERENIAEWRRDGDLNAAADGSADALEWSQFASASGSAAVAALLGQTGRGWGWLLVALSLVAPIALSIACLVRRRSGTTTSSQGQVRLSERLVLSLGEGSRRRRWRQRWRRRRRWVGYASPRHPKFQAEFSEGGPDSVIFLDDLECDSWAMPQVLAIGRGVGPDAAFLPPAR